MKFLLGVVVGSVAMWLYQSERVREEAQRRLSTAPATLQQARQSAVSATAAGAERVSEAIDGAPLPPQVRDAASRATSAVRTTAEGMGQRPDADPTGDEEAGSVS
jgi:hypothetical protein